MDSRKINVDLGFKEKCEGDCGTTNVTESKEWN